MADAKEPQGIDAFLADEDQAVQQFINGNPEITLEELPVASEEEAEPVEQVAEETPAEPETPVVEEPAEVPETATEPEPEPETPPLAAQPEPTEKKKGVPDKSYGEMRRLRKELAERDARLAELEKAAKATPAAPTEPVEDEMPDPIGDALRAADEAKKAAAEAKQETAALAEQTRQERLAQQIKDDLEKDAAAFKVDNPDYEDAIKFVVEKRREQHEHSGLLDTAADEWIEKNPDAVETHLKRMNETQGKGWDMESFEDIREAAKDMAFQIQIYRESQGIIMNNRARGRSVAAAGYAIAKSMGYQGAAPAVPQAPVAPAPQTARERVQKAKAAAETQKPFTAKLPTMPTNPSPLPKQVTKRAEILKMSDAEMDKFLDAMDSRDEAGAWMEALD